MRSSSSFLALASVLASLSEGAGATPSAHLRSLRAEAGAGQCWCSQDTDYAGGDLGWLTAGSAAECCSACSTYKGCTVSVFFANRCYLKNSTKKISAPSDTNHLACKPHAGKSTKSLRDEESVIKSESCRVYGCGGGYKPSHGCQCTSSCKTHNNCCYDYNQHCSRSGGKLNIHAPSCKSYGCGYYRKGSPCQCTSKCGQYKNCCHDYKASCLAHHDDDDDVGESSRTQGRSHHDDDHYHADETSRTQGGSHHDDDNDDAGKSSRTRTQGGSHHDDDNDDAGESSRTRGTNHHEDNDDAGESSTTQSSSSKAVQTTSSKGTTSTAATTAAVTEATTTAAATKAAATTEKAKATTEAPEATTSTSMPTSDTTGSETDTSDTTKATHDSTTVPKHTSAKAPTSSSDGSSSSSSTDDSSESEGNDSSDATTTQPPKHSASSTSQQSTTILTTTQDSSTVANAEKSSDSKEKKVSDDTELLSTSSSSTTEKSSDNKEKKVSDDLNLILSAGSSSSSSSTTSRTSRKAGMLALSLADALNRKSLANGLPPLPTLPALQKSPLLGMGKTSSGDEDGKKDKHGANKIVILKKFLQTMPRWNTGHKAFHNALGWIALLAGAAVFATFVLLARTQLRRTREQEEAEAERLLEPTGNLCE